MCSQYYNYKMKNIKDIIYDFFKEKEIKKEI